MKILVLLFLSLIVGTLLGIQLHIDPGYLLIGYDNWTIEANLWSAFWVLIVAYLLFSHIYVFFLNFLDLPSKLRHFSVKKAESLVHKSFLAFSEGKWKLAEKFAAKALRYNSKLQAASILAALSSQQKGKDIKADDYLQKAFLLDNQQNNRIHLTQVRLYLQRNQFEKATALLEQILQENPQQLFALSLLKKTFIHLQNWEKLEKILPVLKKNQLISLKEEEKLRLHIYSQRLQKGNSINYSCLEKVWKDIPNYWKKNPILIRLYVFYLIQNQKMDEAEMYIRKSIHQAWDDILIAYYGQIHSTYASKQLAQAETWLEQFPQNPILLCTAGQLAYYNQLWGKAKSYLEKSLTVKPSTAAYQSLTQLLIQLGEKDLALYYYEQNLKASLK